MNLDHDKRRTGVRLACLIALVLTAALLSACGGESKSPPPPGSPENPLVATRTPEAATTAGRLNEAAPVTKGSGKSGAASEGATPKAAEQPGYQKLVERQTHKPRNRFTPCNLVTKAQAGAIVGQAADSQASHR
jgi:hypothetical protein